MAHRIPLAAAVAILAAVLFSTMWSGTAHPAYAIQQTVEAFELVRFVHVTMDDPNGKLADERWIEMGSDGNQARYFQRGADATLAMTIVDDGQTTSVYYQKHHTAVLYDHNQKQYMLVGEFRSLLRDLAGKGEPGRVEIQLNVDHEGRRAHRVKLVGQDLTWYIDPETKLPIAVGLYRLSYDEPPTGIFRAVWPEGTTVLDKRSGAPPTATPDWLKSGDVADDYFRQGTAALSRQQYRQAVDFFAQAVEIQPRMNWAWFGMGQAQYRLGLHKDAVRSYSKVMEMFAQLGWDVTYCRFARGLAYAAQNLNDEARKDLMVALPVMVKALRNPEAAEMFDRADVPTYRKADQGLINKAGGENMLRRLRKITGLEFGTGVSADGLVNEDTILAWEQWLATTPEIHVDPHYELIFNVPGLIRPQNK
jgi:tetratricopeptide (TPR) repeat protein